MTAGKGVITISAPEYGELTGDLSGKTTEIVLNLSILGQAEIGLVKDIEEKTKSLQSLRMLIAEINSKINKVAAKETDK
jgi:hypothetical protein